MKAYKELLKTVLSNGETHTNRTNIETLSVWGHQLKIDMQEGFPLLTTRALPFRWIATELFWMLAGSTNSNELTQRGVHTWDPWGTEERCRQHGREQGDLGPTYGYLLRHFGGVYMPTAEQRLWDTLNALNNKQNGHDQLWELCVRMDTEPYSRRLILSQWDPCSAWDLDVPPCAPLIQIKIHDEYYMSLRVDMRSSDAFVGLAFDIAHFALLLEMLAWCTLRKPRWLVLQIGDLHIYKTHLSAVNELLERVPRALPKLMISKPMFHANPAAPGQDTFINLLQFRFDDFRLDGYSPHPKISVPVAI